MVEEGGVAEDRALGELDVEGLGHLGGAVGQQVLLLDGLHLSGGAFFFFQRADFFVFNERIFLGAQTSCAHLQGALQLSIVSKSFSADWSINK